MKFLSRIIFCLIRQMLTTNMLLSGVFNLIRFIYLLAPLTRNNDFDNCIRNKNVVDVQRQQKCLIRLLRAAVQENAILEGLCVLIGTLKRRVKMRTATPGRDRTIVSMNRTATCRKV